MSEKNSRNTVRDHLCKVPGLHWTRVEGALTPGIPDINICYKGREAWIEAKQLDEWPKRASTLVKVGLSPEQCLWLQERKDCGGRSFVLAKIANEWFLWSGGFRMLREGSTQDNLRWTACWSSKGKFEVESFLECIFGIVREENR